MQWVRELHHYPATAGTSAPRKRGRLELGLGQPTPLAGMGRWEGVTCLSLSLYSYPQEAPDSAVDIAWRDGERGSLRIFLSVVSAVRLIPGWGSHKIIARVPPTMTADKSSPPWLGDYLLNHTNSDRNTLFLTSIKKNFFRSIISMVTSINTIALKVWKFKWKSVEARQVQEESSLKHNAGPWWRQRWIWETRGRPLGSAAHTHTTTHSKHLVNHGWHNIPPQAGIEGQGHRGQREWNQRGTPVKSIHWSDYS